MFINPIGSYNNNEEECSEINQIFWITGLEDPSIKFQ